MAKIPRVTKKSYADVIKQNKLQQIKVQKEKELAIQAANDLAFDSFVKETARKMLKDMPKYELQICKGGDASALPSLSSENSIWAPWTKMFKK